MWEALERAAAAIHQAEHVLAMSNLRSVAPPVEAKRVYRAGVEQFVHDQRRAERRKRKGDKAWRRGESQQYMQRGDIAADRRGAVPAPEPTKADPCEPTEAEVAAFYGEIKGFCEWRVALRAAFALFGPRYLKAKIDALPKRPAAGDDWRYVESAPHEFHDIHVPSLLRALGDTGSGR